MQKKLFVGKDKTVALHMLRNALLEVGKDRTSVLTYFGTVVDVL